MKDTLLESGPPGNCTWTVPVVAPEGTLASMKELETTRKAVAVPLKLTPVAPVRESLKKYRFEPNEQ